MQVNFRSQSSEAIQQICDNVCSSGTLQTIVSNEFDVDDGRPSMAYSKEIRRVLASAKHFEDDH